MPTMSSPRSADQELITQFVSGEMPLGQRIGGLSMFSAEFKRGSGNQVFGSNSKGIWLGAANFEDAPFRVSMDGKIYLQIESGALVIDANGITQFDENGVPVGFWGIRTGMF